ncbi:acyl-CoA dehydrogenase family protein [Ectopseudomonas alcaliphila]|uniref:acyl-CoA dehydrogenase family protein n=1 Tax=Ectopseudomonas alcaliphila TaxID=101564 RepID=UPI0009F3421E
MPRQPHPFHWWRHARDHERDHFEADGIVEAAFGPQWRESLVERLYRDNRILSIGGGTREIMNEIIAKQMGL